MQKLDDASGAAVTMTSPDVIRTRAFRHYAEGMRQYISIFLGDVEAAHTAMIELRVMVKGWPASKLTAPPSLRAQLYRTARELVRSKYMTLLGLQENTAALASKRTALPWRPINPAMSREYTTKVEDLRLGLPRAQAEILELRYARELTTAELAFVIGQDESVALSALNQAEQAAKQVVGESHIQRHTGLRGMVLEAFALLPAAERATDDAVDERPSLPKGTRLGDRYVIVERVGIGAFSDVYRAHDAEVPGHVVALKLLHEPAISEKARSSSLRELLLIASVFHPSVVQFKDHGWYDNRLWFVMPWYEGETLETRIQRAPLTPREARQIFEPLAQALATLHAAGIRHQDIKPDNVFLTRIEGFGQSETLPILLDLGVAAREAEALVAGTPMYFAPEVAARFAGITTAPPIGKQADVFALALTLRNALEPDTQEDVRAAAVEAFIQHRAHHVPMLPTRPEFKYLEPYFLRWLAQDPTERPSAEVFAQELKALTEPEERRKRLMATLRWMLPVSFGIFIAFLSVVYVLSKESRFQRLEATKARLEAQGTKEILNIEQARRRALEDDKSDLLSRYERDKLNKAQLMTELATAEQQVRILGRSLSNAEKNSKTLDEQRVALQNNLTTLGQDLSAERSRGAQVIVQLTETQTQLNTVRNNLSDLQIQHKATIEQLENAKKETKVERDRVETLQEDIKRMDTARAKLESELSRAKERIDELERQVFGGRGK